MIYQPASWSRGNALIFGAGSLRFKFQTGQFIHNLLPMAGLCYGISSKEAVLPGCYDAEMVCQLVTYFGMYRSIMNDLMITSSGFPRSEKVGNFVKAFPDREKVGKNVC